jgi:hypothetical protein
LISGIVFLIVGIFFTYKWNKRKQNHRNENYNYYSSQEQAINNNNKQDFIQNVNTTNYYYDPIMIPVPVINKHSYHGQEIIQNEITTNHEPITIPANDDYYRYEQKII